MPTPRNANTASAVMPAGQLEPVDPVYTKANRSSALGTFYPVPSRPAWDPARAPQVRSGFDTTGMRYLYSDARTRQPVSELGTGPDVGIAVWSSEFQPVLGVLKDWGFYDRLFRAGYNGFNLGLSFRVPVNPSVGTNSPGANIRMRTPNRVITVNPFRRSRPAANLRG